MKNIIFSKLQSLIRNYFFKRNFFGYFLMLAGIAFLTFFVMFVVSIVLYGVPDKSMYLETLFLTFVYMIVAFWGARNPYVSYCIDED